MSHSAANLRITIMCNELFEDIFGILEQTRAPVLISTLLKTLRGFDTKFYTVSGTCWSIPGSVADFVDDAMDAGFVVKIRRCGIGFAAYIYHSDFSCVDDDQGRTHKVQDW